MQPIGAAASFKTMRAAIQILTGFEGKTLAFKSKQDLFQLIDVWGQVSKIITAQGSEHYFYLFHIKPSRKQLATEFVITLSESDANFFIVLQVQNKKYRTNFLENSVQVFLAEKHT